MCVRVLGLFWITEILRYGRILPSSTLSASKGKQLTSHQPKTGFSHSATARAPASATLWRRLNQASWSANSWCAHALKWILASRSASLLESPSPPRVELMWSAARFKNLKKKAKKSDVKNGAEYVTYILAFPTTFLRVYCKYVPFKLIFYSLLSGGGHRGVVWCCVVKRKG